MTSITEPAPDLPLIAAAHPVSRRPPSAYAALNADVRSLGLMRRRYLAYGIRTSALLATFVVTGIGMLLIGDSWWQVVPAIVLAVVFSQLGFLAHDAAHKQVFRTARANEWSARLVSTLGIGLSYGWWMKKHSRHHRSPNQEGRDPDVAPGGLAFTPQAVRDRKAWLKPVTTRQGYLFFPMLLLEGVSLHIGGLRALADQPNLPHRRLEASLILMRFVGYATVLVLIMSPGRAAAFLAIQLAIFGVLLGAAFAPAHKGMPMVRRDARPDFIRRQVLMSRNIHGGWLVGFAMGGLNYQIEHHLFPSMPRDNLRHATSVVRAFCRQHDIAYTETSLAASYGIVIRYLNDVGIGAADPFDCPFVASYRG